MPVSALPINLLVGVLVVTTNAAWPRRYKRTLSVDNNTFLNSFDFYNGDDPTHGYVDYVSRDEALASGLVTLGSGQIMMAAERTDSNRPRRSVRVHSKALYTRGIFIIDLEHAPTGCGTWPAFWTCGPSWPAGGEIDILETVHRQVHDQTTLHTSEGCSMAGVNESSFSGSWTKAKNGSDATDCFVNDPEQYSNSGCGVMDDDPASAGQPFNAHNGGVLALVWDDSGVRAYGWARAAIPESIAARQSPEEQSWGQPYARFEFGSACAASHFYEHQIIFDLTFCGDWAGASFDSQCSDLAKGASCVQFVSRGANVEESFWRVNYVDVWQVDGDPVAGSDRAVEPVAYVEGERFHGVSFLIMRHSKLYRGLAVNRPGRGF